MLALYAGWDLSWSCAVIPSLRFGCLLLGCCIFLRVDFELRCGHDGLVCTCRWMCMKGDKLYVRWTGIVRALSFMKVCRVRNHKLHLASLRIYCFMSQGGAAQEAASMRQHVPLRKGCHDRSLSSNSSCSLTVLSLLLRASR